MGVGPEEATFLARAARTGVSFAKTALIGRQSLLLNDRELRAALALANDQISAAEAQAIVRDSGGYAEPFLRSLGAEEIVSIDASDYEGCTVVHDLNQPAPDELRDQFSVVIDGGSLEHIFSFERAAESCMRLVRPDGHLLAMTPANNEMGHGFYQFSPELYFRLLVPENGFRVEGLYLAEALGRTRWYEVIDPAIAGYRARVHNRGSTYLFVRARRIGVVPAPIVVPQQSDYRAMWAAPQAPTAPPGTPPSRRARLLRLVPRRLRRRVQRTVAAWVPTYDPTCFRRVPPRDLMVPSVGTGQALQGPPADFDAGLLGQQPGAGPRFPRLPNPVDE